MVNHAKLKMLSDLADILQKKTPEEFADYAHQFKGTSEQLQPQDFHYMDSQDSDDSDPLNKQKRFNKYRQIHNQ